MYLSLLKILSKALQGRLVPPILHDLSCLASDHQRWSTSLLILIDQITDRCPPLKHSITCNHSGLKAWSELINDRLALLIRAWSYLFTDLFERLFGNHAEAALTLLWDSVKIFLVLQILVEELLFTHVCNLIFFPFLKLGHIIVELLTWAD